MQQHNRRRLRHMKLIVQQHREDQFFLYSTKRSQSEKNILPIRRDRLNNCGWPRIRCGQVDQTLIRFHCCLFGREPAVVCQTNFFTRTSLFRFLYSIWKHIFSERIAPIPTYTQKACVECHFSVDLIIMKSICLSEHALNQHLSYGSMKTTRRQINQRIN